MKRKLKKILYILRKDERVIERQVKEKAEWIGNGYGGFGVCSRFFRGGRVNPVVYSFGIGEDVSFDLSMIKRYNAEIYAFDPTPRSVEWVKNNVRNKNFHFYPYGISDKDQKEKFYLPQRKKYVSGSVLMREGLHQDSIEVEMYRLKTIMDKMGHKRLDVLKMDIEGSEFKVIPDVLSILGKYEIGQLCVEVHGRFTGSEGYQRNRELVSFINKYGYLLAYVSDTFEELTFIKSDRYCVT